MIEYDISDFIFRKFVKLVYTKAGIHLTDSKKALLKSRTSKILRERNIQNYKAYLSIIENDTSGKELRDFINLISTNTTHFFREKKHFDFMKELAHGGLWRNARDIRIWCAASSTGEEPYSIAMTMAELFDLNQTKVEIIATDIDTNVLEKARRGVFSLDNINISDTLLRKYFKKGKGKAAGFVKVRQELAQILNFKYLNLIEDYKLKGEFDIIFCRNVFIYFDNRTKENIVRRMLKFVKKGGYLFIGHSESLNSLNHDYKYVMPATYQKI